jgi:hypothetical protein
VAPTAPSGHRGQRQAQPRPPASAATLFVVWILVFASVVPWRHGDIYTGGLDPVVVGKAAVSITALAIAAWRPRRPGRRVGVRSALFVLAIGAIGTIGALTSGEFGSSAVLTVRLLLIAATILLIASRWSPRTMVTTLLSASGTIGIVAGISGIGSLQAAGRLEGAVPPLHPNELALMVTLPLIALVREFALGKSKAWHAAAALVLAGILVASESRTAFAAGFLALLAILVTARRLSVRALATLVLAVPLCAALLVYTRVFTDLVSRGEDVGRIATLNSRTIAWDVVLAIPDSAWVHWWGAGLSTKQVAVRGQYWDYQVLDSSWVSALAQVGVIGLLLLALWSVATLVSSLRPRTIGGIAFPLIVFLLVRSFLESGLVDSSTAFVLFFTLAVLVEPGSRAIAATARTPRTPRTPVKPGTAGTPTRSGHG